MIRDHHTKSLKVGFGQLQVPEFVMTLPFTTEDEKIGITMEIPITANQISWRTFRQRLRELQKEEIIPPLVRRTTIPGGTT